MFAGVCGQAESSRDKPVLETQPAVCRIFGIVIKLFIQTTQKKKKRGQGTIYTKKRVLWHHEQGRYLQGKGSNFCLGQVTEIGKVKVPCSNV